MAICCKLNAIRQALFQIMHEMVGASGIALSNKPAGNQFRIGVERNPSPHVARALFPVFWSAVFRFGIDKAPDFVALDSLTVKISENPVLILGTRTSEIAQQLHDCCAMNACHPCHRAKRVAFHQSGNHRLALVGAQFVHALNMLERSSIVKRKYEEKD